MSMESIRNHPVWRRMSPAKRSIMEEVMVQAQGKKLSDSAGIIMSAMNKMQQKGESFTREETEILTGELMKDMSAADRARLELIRNMINNRK